MNIDALKTRLTDIQYQFLRDNTTVYTDLQLIDITKQLLSSITRDLPDGQIDDTLMPTSWLGCTLDWTVGPTQNDRIVRIVKNATQEDSDLSATIISPEIDAWLNEYNSALALTELITGGDSIPVISYSKISSQQSIIDANLISQQIITE